LLLQGGQRLNLSPTENHEVIQVLTILEGVGRIAASFSPLYRDVTLAFCGAAPNEWFRPPSFGRLHIEAVCDLKVQLRTHSEVLPGKDLLSDWLLDLHLVRHPTGALSRLSSLLNLLTLRFGHRTGDGYELPFQLTHTRLAELIGVTRSTVTRMLALLRQQGYLSVQRSNGGLLLSPLFINSDWPAVRTTGHSLKQ